MLHDSDNVSDSQSIQDDIGDIGAAASNYESIPDTAVASVSDSIPHDIGAAELDSDSVQDDMNIYYTENIPESYKYSNISDNNCQRSRVHHKNCEYAQDKEENLVPSQITIMQSNDTPFSSDESVLDVGVDECKVDNLWGDMDVNDIPLDVDTDSSTDSEPLIVKAENPPDVVFSPLSNIEH